MERARTKDPPRFISWIYGSVIVIAITVSLIAVVVFDPADITWFTTAQVISYHPLRTEFDESVPAGSDTTIRNPRAPRGILTVIVGAGLAVSGVIMQILTRNPLVDPYLLDISVNAGAGATMVTIFGVFPGSPITPLTFDVLLGVVITTPVVDAFTIAGGGLTPLRLVLLGVMLFAVFSALSSSVAFVGSDLGTAQSVVFWTLGFVAGVIWVETFFPLVVLIAVLLFFLVKARRLNALATGESTVAVMGIDVTRLRMQVFVLQAVLVDTSVTVLDGTGFVDLVIPHLAYASADVAHRVILSAAAFMGGLPLIRVDITAHVVGGSQKMPLSAVTGLVGASLFLYPISRSHYSCGGAE